MLLPLPLALDLRRIAPSNLDGTDDGRHVMDAVTFSSCLATPPTSASSTSTMYSPPILSRVRPHHRGPQFVEQDERGLVAGDPELALGIGGPTSQASAR